MFFEIWYYLKYIKKIVLPIGNSVTVLKYCEGKKYFSL